ncbi:hypothetical protein CEXT_283211 [Caerostris extrusa]|uniref:Uncharacterized protein n=1 Tax=Caerostris extrusa TaxID=172846 RepID=A0AAV4UUY6_CAEEX|nr:hypothetical protein CEXT_283211 [Caerostris extrusa]
MVRSSSPQPPSFLLPPQMPDYAFGKHRSAVNNTAGKPPGLPSLQFIPLDRALDGTGVIQYHKVIKNYLITNALINRCPV